MVYRPTTSRRCCLCVIGWPCRCWLSTPRNRLLLFTIFPSFNWRRNARLAFYPVGWLFGLFSTNVLIFMQGLLPSFVILPLDHSFSKCLWFPSLLLPEYWRICDTRNRRSIFLWWNDYFLPWLEFWKSYLLEFAIRISRDDYAGFMDPKEEAYNQVTLILIFFMVCNIIISPSWRSHVM